MPTDLLLPAFALTLLANAVLIALAIRGLRRAKTDSAVTRDWFTPTATARPPAPEVRARDETPEPPAGAGPTMPSVPRTPDPAPAPEAEPVAAHPDLATGPDPALATPARSRLARPHQAARSLPPPSLSSPGAEPVPRRGRRKFSLPPIDDDHEKVTRSIESFLAGSDGPVESSEPVESAETTASARDGDARPPATTGGRSRTAEPDGPGNVPTTIALVAIAGLGSSTNGRAGEVNDPVAMLERTLRGAARGGDEVHRAGDGRFRIVLPATGELAARAYLRRIRATVEPQFEAAERPLRLVVATATALNVPIRSATLTARRRLEAALGAQAADAEPSGPADGAPAGPAGATREGVDHDHDHEPEPRAAGD